MSGERMTRVLVVAAHPDDEILGCGGVMARHSAAGDEVRVLIVAEGATSRDGNDGNDGKAEVAKLQAAARAAAKVVGAAEVRFLGLPDNRLDGLQLLDVVQALEAVIAELQPHTVYTHHGGDLNLDHRIVHQAVLTACRPLPGQTVRALYAFEVASSSEWGSQATGGGFAPDTFIDVAATIEAKLQALRCYDLEMRDFPHARSYDAVRAQATLRGASVGCTAAEAFMLIRRVTSADEQP